MNYFELQVLENVPRIKDYSGFNDQDLIMGSQKSEILDLSHYKVHPQLIQGRKKIENIYQPSSNLSGRLILSSLARKLFEKFRKDNIKYYSCPLYKDQKLIPNFWITDIIEFDDGWVDFNLSQFLYKKKVLIESEDENQRQYKSLNQTLSFKNLKNLEVFIREEMWHMEELVPKKIFFKEDCPFDILSIPISGIFNFIVSEKFKEQLISEGMDKGIEFKPLEIPDDEWYGPNGLRKEFYK